jgi:hypothetical protein
VRDASRRERDLAAAPRDQPAAEREGELALEHVERLVEVVVVQRRSLPAGGNRVLDERDVPAAVLAAQEHARLEVVVRHSIGHDALATGMCQRPIRWL